MAQFVFSAFADEAGASLDEQIKALVENGIHYISEATGGKSILEVIGGWIAIIFRPLGFGTWQATVATLLGLLAKEEVVGAFGTLSSMGDAEAAFTMFVGGNGVAGYSFMIFNLLCAPCFGAMGAIRREMNDWKWTAFAIGYMTVFAYAVSMIVYQTGAWFTGGGSIVGTVIAAILFGYIMYMLVRKNPHNKKATKK